MGEMRGNRSGRIRGSEARRERGVNLSVCVSLPAHLSRNRVVRLSCSLIFRCQHFCPRLLHFAVFFFRPGIKKKRKKKSFPCVFCMTWCVGNKMRLCVLVRVVCFCLCKRERWRQREIECVKETLWQRRRDEDKAIEKDIGGCNVCVCVWMGLMLASRKCCCSYIMTLWSDMEIFLVKRWWN